MKTFVLIMLIDKRSLIIGLCVGMIFIGSVGLLNAISTRDRINELENQISQRESTIQELQNQKILLEEELGKKESDLEAIEESLHSSKENYTQLITRVEELEVNNTKLESEIQLLDSAIMMIGQEDVTDLLRAYAEVSLNYKELFEEYDDLLLKYNALLSQSP
jgi:septal ring factor EnvC (AmiA/AmiB activator)